MKYYLPVIIIKVVIKNQNCMQIENEYQTIEPAFHEKGPPYVLWAAKMAVDFHTGVPWVMCKQDDAPGPVVRLLFGLLDNFFRIDFL